MPGGDNEEQYARSEKSLYRHSALRAGAAQRAHALPWAALVPVCPDCRALLARAGSDQHACRPHCPQRIIRAAKGICGADSPAADCRYLDADHPTNGDADHPTNGDYATNRHIAAYFDTSSNRDISSAPDTATDSWSDSDYRRFSQQRHNRRWQRAGSNWHYLADAPAHRRHRHRRAGGDAAQSSAIWRPGRYAWKCPTLSAAGNVSLNATRHLAAGGMGADPRAKSAVS